MTNNLRLPLRRNGLYRIIDADDLWLADATNTVVADAIILAINATAKVGELRRYMIAGEWVHKGERSIAEEAMYLTSDADALIAQLRADLANLGADYGKLLKESNAYEIERDAVSLSSNAYKCEAEKLRAELAQAKANDARYRVARDHATFHEVHGWEISIPAPKHFSLMSSAELAMESDELFDVAIDSSIAAVSGEG